MCSELQTEDRGRALRCMIDRISRGFEVDFDFEVDH